MESRRLIRKNSEHQQLALSNSEMNQLQALMKDAQRESNVMVGYHADGTVRHVIPKSAASVRTLSLRELELPALIQTGMHKTHGPLGESATRRTTLATALCERSRAIQAGAKLISVEAAIEPVQPVHLAGQAQNAPIMLARRNGRFDVIEAAGFDKTPDGADLSVSTLPVHSALIDMDTMPSYGFRVTLSRQDQKAYEEGQLAASALVAIALGLGRAADAALLEAITDTTPSAFTLASAAGMGLEFGELRALVGTSGTGAAVGQDGTLRVSGVLAELTPDTSATIVGAFSRAAVAVHDDITLIAERTDKQGGLSITCWANMSGLVPLEGAFWTVSA